MDRKLNIALVFGLSLLSSACASKFYVPGNRFLSPESGGKFMRGDIKTGGVGVTSVQVADDITLQNPDTAPKLEKNSAGLIGTQLGIVNRLDLYATMPLGGPLFAGAKVQLLGDSFQDAKKGNFSLSLAGGVATGTQTQTVGVSAGANNSTSYESKTKFSGYEALLIAGYRVSDWTLFYLSPFYTHIDAKVTLQQTSGTGVTTVNATPQGAGDMKGATLGLRLGKHFFVNGEVSLTETTWEQKEPVEVKADKFSNVAVGFALGGAW